MQDRPATLKGITTKATSAVASGGIKIRLHRRDYLTMKLRLRPVWIRWLDTWETGEDFYGLAEGSQDHYLGILIDKAIETRDPVESSTQIWGTATDHTDRTD